MKNGTGRDYRSSLDRIILPKLGKRKLSGIRPADILELVRDGGAAERSESTLANRLKPLGAIFD